MSVGQSQVAATGSAGVWPEPVRSRLTQYYTRYYRDALGIPGWRDLVAARLGEESYEAGHLARLEAVLGRPVAGLRLLNVGCGTGGFTVMARRAGARAVGVDAEPAAVEICRLKALHEGGGGAALGAVEALPFRDGTFDLVYCFSTLEHVGSVSEAVREMMRVARSGGAVYVHGPNALSCYEGHYKLFWLPRMPKLLARWYLRARQRPTGFVDTLQPLLRGRLESLFRAAGARVTRLEAAEARMPETGSPLWPLVRAYYRLASVSPHIELLAQK
ncbi:MAG: methyltransferase domain-containing protein [Candidatus Rokubacteria bacterium]|nr:methyltransferase domain-containing protein [Candidatus Rokubacteria bacterium]